MTGISAHTHTHLPSHTHTHTLHTAHCTHTRTHSSSGKLVTGYSSSELAGSVPCTNSVRNVRIGMCAYSNLVSSPGLLHRIQQHEKGWGTWLDCIVSMHIQGYPAMMSSWLKAHRFSAPSCTESHWFLGPLHPAPASPLGQGSPSGGGRLSGGGQSGQRRNHE